VTQQNTNVSESLHTEDKMPVNASAYKVPGLEGWHLKRPEKPLLLSDERLLEYRHPAEHRMLALALGLLAILLAAGMWFKEWDLLLALGAIYLSMLVLSFQAATSYTLRGAEVTPTQFADIYQTVHLGKVKLRDLCRTFIANVFGHLP
jgi:hypothetical protein